ncbi:DUF1173 domain-containing protein [Burkholderia cenocepacia]|jgi:hypothetical protein|uniref:DUF1173 family protein n=1 Tax=Burkholderia cenocepacia TaxID=95486 RepID=A0ABD4UGB1_9BURK|nr:DUF1173 domain-containing protein [Burkholderia cenocepacia]MCW3696680.1 DUF1173 family protein [Burkholderia cenocepacia]MCW3704896.1 DUF1173 family protein [Burkholderia cenocepacia]MCW3713156.1 DUF1173 family protein [Burkholderia cenocepacia]MCW3721907.1 DUF1173 family protein [Burkholderia cenocepacia]MCW3729148.1 DUF1173 family protein [Burkholderia cenocepacia]
MQNFELDGLEYEAGSNSLLAKLPAAHEGKTRPLCLCSTPPIPMYIARFDGRYQVKRMPGTGAKHKLGCDSYETPPGLSGYGDVEGAAIVEDPESGEVTLKFGFALAKGAAREMPEPSGDEPDSIKTDGKKLTLRGLLHYLWEQAGLNRWSPAMAGKRNWSVVRKYLLLAAAGKNAKKMSLEDMLYVPEMFVGDQKDRIAQRRTEHLARISVSESGKPHFVLVIGELKEIATARFGFKLVIKHLPDYGLMVDEKTKKRIEKVFASELEIWAATEGTHLMVIATASLSAAGIATVQEVSMMLTNESWIPFESLADIALLKALATRRYQKCLRYNQTAKHPIATALLTDAERGTALYVVPADVSSAYQSELDALIAESELDSWIWRPGTEVMPPLPLTAFDAARKAQRQPRPLASAPATNAVAAPRPATAREPENRTPAAVKAPETEPDPTRLFAEPPVVDELPPMFDEDSPYTDEDRPANWL